MVLNGTEFSQSYKLYTKNLKAKKAKYNYPNKIKYFTLNNLINFYTLLIISTMRVQLTLAIVCFYCMANAQTPEKAQAQVKYQFIHVRDTTQKKRPYTEDLVLILGKTSSAYKSLIAEKQDQLREKEVTDQIKKASNPNSLDLLLTGSRPVSQIDYFQFISSNKLFTVYKLNNYYLTEEALPKINWNITKDTMNINEYNCQKATAHFKGRDYIAWFCSDLPIHTGPWKLNGLPGLILQACDLKNEVVFKFAGFEDISKKKLMVKLPSDAIKASQKDVNRLISLKQKNPAAYAKLPEGKINGILGNIDYSRINSISVNSPSINFGEVINNPIELTEKK